MWRTVEPFGGDRDETGLRSKRVGSRGLKKHLADVFGRRYEQVAEDVAGAAVVTMGFRSHGETVPMIMLG